MQPRAKSHSFSDLFAFEEKHSNNTILALLKTHCHHTAMIPLLDEITFSAYQKDDQFLNQDQFIRDQMYVKMGGKLTSYEHHLSIIRRSVPTLGLFDRYQRAWSIIFPMAKDNLYCFTLLGNLCEYLGAFYYNLDDDRMAAMYHLAGLQIKIASFLLSPHQLGADIANSFNSLGLVCYRQKQYQMSEMCYQYALAIAIDCIGQNKLTGLICKIYYNSSLNYIAMSHDPLFIEQSNATQVYDLRQIDNAIHYLTLADKNLKIILPDTTGAFKEKIHFIQKEIRQQRNALEKIKKIAYAMLLETEYATVGSVNKAELPEEEYITRLMESTVSAVIDDEKFIPPSLSPLPALNAPSNPARSTTADITLITSSGSKKVIPFHLPKAPSQQCTLSPSSNRKYFQATAQITSPKVKPVVRSDCYNSHRKCEEQQKQREQQLQAFAIYAYHNPSAATFFPSSANRALLATPVCHAQSAQKRGNNTPLYKISGSP